MTHDVATRVALATAGCFAAVALILASVDVVRLSSTGAGETRWLLSIAALSAIAATIALADGRIVRVDRASLRLLVVLLGWLLLSALRSGNAVDAVAAVLAYGALGLVAVRLVDAYGWVSIATITVVVFGAFLAVALVMEGVSDPELVVDGRLFLTALDANQLARFSGLALVSSVCLAATRQRPFVMLGVVGAPIAVGVLAATQSRTGAVAAAAASAVLVWHWVDRRLAIGITVLAVVGLGIAAPLLLDTSVQELVSRDGEVASLGTFRGRSTTWSAAIDEVRDDPLLGVGPTLDDEFFAEARQSGQIAWRARNAHSLWGHLVVVGGLPALLLFGAATTAFFFGVRGPDAAYRSAVVVLLLVDGFSEAVFWAPGLSSFLLAGVFATRSSVASPAAVDPGIEVGTLGPDRGRVAVPG